MTDECLFTMIVDTEEEDYPEALDDVLDVLNDVGANFFTVEYAGVSWEKLSGKMVLTPEKIVTMLVGLRGYFRLTVVGDTSRPGMFWATRYSHDEPTGASFDFAPSSDYDLIATGNYTKED